MYPGIVLVIELVKNIAIEDKDRLNRKIGVERLKKSVIVFQSQVSSEPENGNFGSYHLDYQLRK